MRSKQNTQGNYGVVFTDASAIILIMNGVSHYFICRDLTQFDGGMHRCARESAFSCQLLSYARVRGPPKFDSRINTRIEKLCQFCMNIATWHVYLLVIDNL